jgi:hypothetical protein
MSAAASDRLVYWTETGRLATDCPFPHCGQLVFCDRNGSSYRFRCCGGHKNNEIAPLLDPRVLLELGRAEKVAKPGTIKLTSRVGNPKDVRRTRWGWQDWAPLGCIGVIAGNGGDGKGIVSVHVLARLTRGELPGDLNGEPVNVGWVGDEDNWNEVILPRLIAAGADVRRVIKINAEPGQVLDVVRDITSLEAKVTEDRLKAIAFEAIAETTSMSWMSTATARCEARSHRCVGLCARRACWRSPART